MKIKFIEKMKTVIKTARKLKLSNFEVKTNQLKI